MHFPDSILGALALNSFAEMLRRHYDACRVRFQLTGNATPMHSPALADLLGRLPGPPPE